MALGPAYGDGGDGNGDVNRTTVYKTADETINNDNTPTIDSDVKVALEANTLYTIEMLVCWSSSNTSDWRFGFDAPSGSDLGWHYAFHFGRSEEKTGAEIEVLAGEFVVDVVMLTKVDGSILTGGTAGDLGLKWSQDTSHGDDTILRKNTYLTVTKVE